MSYYYADEISVLRQTIASLQQDMSRVVNENRDMYNIMALLKHRCNEFDIAYRQDLISIRRLESENNDKNKRITNLKNRFFKFRSYQMSNDISLQEMEERLDAIKDMDPEFIETLLAMQRTSIIATSCAELVLA